MFTISKENHSATIFFDNKNCNCYKTISENKEFQNIVNDKLLFFLENVPEEQQEIDNTNRKEDFISYLSNAISKSINAKVKIHNNEEAIYGDFDKILD